VRLSDRPIYGYFGRDSYDYFSCPSRRDDFSCILLARQRWRCRFDLENLNLLAKMRSFLRLLAAGAAIITTSCAAGQNASAKITTPLRIMPLGASVTFGVGSTTGDSYRKDLLELLTSQQSATVEYVGTQKSGNDFTNNACEAFPGDVIAQIAAKAATAVPSLKPNLVLADMGTNNCNNGGTVPDAGANVTAAIKRIYEDSPGATVILATLLVNAVPAQEACRQTVNPQYEDLVKTLAAAGNRIVLVDMRNPPAPLVGLTTKDLNGTRHPNDGGYVKMAAIWQSGIVEAQAKGFLDAPTADSTSNTASNSSSVNSNSASDNASQAATAVQETAAASVSISRAAASTTSTPAIGSPSPSGMAMSSTSGSPRTATTSLFRTLMAVWVPALVMLVSSVA
jgi:hypothetical protein